MVGEPAHRGLSVVDLVDPHEGDFRWSSVSLREAVDSGLRLKAAVFDIEGRHARKVLEGCRWPLSRMAGEGGLALAFQPQRFRRVWVERSEFPIYQPGQIAELDPRPAGFLSAVTATDLEALRASHGQILMTRSGRSGSIGRTTYVSRTLHNRVFSDDLIRITCAGDNLTGYLYAFLRTKIGRALIKTNEYGAMIPHIEPSHLETVPIPSPPDALTKRIHALVAHSYALRDESNDLLDEAERVLVSALSLPPLRELRPRYLSPATGMRSYAVKLSDLTGRLDASYHVPVVDSIIRHLKREAAEVTTIGDSRVSKRIILPGRFKRVYVQEGQGTVFFGGKHLFELDPEGKKYLSLSKHGDRIRHDLKIAANMTLISRSGTVGKVAFVGDHWENWIASEHIIRVDPANSHIAGYLYCFLATDYGRELIARFTYGSVVDEIDHHQVARIPVPLLKDTASQTEINRLVLEANAKRTAAYHAEQEAIRVTNDEVIYGAD